jgi:RNA polymerase sigma-70 factor, ECF subfamily
MEAQKASTLGDVLYADKSRTPASEKEWAELVRSVAGGNQLALHALYERAHRPVFTLSVRITGSRETAEEVTLDVFHDVWRRASGYDPANGTVLGWIMNQARSRALDRLRFEKRRKRVAPDAGDPLAETEAPDSLEVLEVRQQGAALHASMQGLTLAEQRALEATFLFGLTHAEAAERLKQPLGTVKTRIRSALNKLRRVLAEKKA